LPSRVGPGKGAVVDNPRRADDPRRLPGRSRILESRPAVDDERVVGAGPGRAHVGPPPSSMVPLTPLPPMTSMAVRSAVDATVGLGDHRDPAARDRHL